MTWNPALRDFISQHLHDDTARLLFSAQRYPEVDMPFVVEQIEARKRLQDKLPDWCALPDIIMSGRVAAEQCSSVATASLKRSFLLPTTRSLCDLTGGMGVDFWYLSQGLDLAIYTERQPLLVAACQHNFPLLAAQSANPPAQIVYREGDARSLPLPDVDTFYLDPARRSTSGGRIYEIEDCEPDLVGWQTSLLAHAQQVLAKLSPMADLTRTFSLLPHTTDCYIVASQRECKELVVSLSPNKPTAPPRIHCYDVLRNGKSVEYHDVWHQSMSAPLATSLGTYLYVPDVTLMKAGLFGTLAQRYALMMLHPDCHYFTADTYNRDFPGRVFRIEECVPFAARTLRSLRASLPQANIATRGFPLSAEALRRRTGIADGGAHYLFGLTLSPNTPLLVVASKAE